MSIGIALTDRPEHDPESLLRDADAAMYRAKRDPSGRRVRFQLFDPVMREQLTQRLELERALQHAIEREEFQLVYQPVVDLGTHRLTAFEALLRWNRPQHGPVGPMDFIPLAEATGLITAIGSWVLDQACAQVLTWDTQAAGAVGVAVNVSAHQLNDEFVDDLARTLNSTGLNASRVCLELTESAVMADIEAAARVLDDLKTLGVSLAIDDFGTGYSSLSYLQRLPFDIVKIDRSFVNGLGDRAADSAIVAATIKMAQAMDITVIAEGVETPAQAEQLRSLQCDYAQGWHFGRPQPADTFNLSVAK